MYIMLSTIQSVEYKECYILLGTVGSVGIVDDISNVPTFFRWFV